MPSLKDIRTRIGSIKNTRQTTRAMKMVSAAKLRRAQDAILNARPYAVKINEIVGKIASTQQMDHPLFKQSEVVKKELVIVITSDRGLCGGFNAQVSKNVFEYYKTNNASKKMDFIFVGRKGADYLRRRGIDPKEIILNLAKEISFSLASDFADRIIKMYSDEGYDQVVVFYNEFKSAISQVLKSQVILPLKAEDQLWDNKLGFAKDYIFEPSAEEIMGQLLKKSIKMQVYRSMLESLASEHGARMNSMENATKNAGEIIRKLTLKYNNARQAAITRELIEITSGAEALNN